jgi:hypothetical protein
MIHGFYTFYINKINLLQNETVITDLLYHRTAGKGRRGRKGSYGKVLKIDRPLAGGFLGLTAVLPLKVVVAVYGHACGVRVQRVQRVLRVLRFDSPSG